MMTIGLTPYLQFKGDAREAMEFYRSVLGGELSMMTFAEGMPEGTIDDASADKIMHASLYVDRGVHLMASDVPPGMEAGCNGTVSLSSSGQDSDDEVYLRRAWDEMTEGGTVEMPLEVAPWGDPFGQFVDKYGIRWMVNI